MRQSTIEVQFKLEQVVKKPKEVRKNQKQEEGICF
jgi:hypothetical protein